MTSLHVKSHHHKSQQKTEYIITSYHISIHADADADAADTQPVTSLTYQPEIPQDITSHNITSNAIVTLNYSRSHSNRDSTITVTAQSSPMQHCYLLCDIIIILTTLCYWLS